MTAAQRRVLARETALVVGLVAAFAVVALVVNGDLRSFATPFAPLFVIGVVAVRALMCRREWRRAGLGDAPTTR